MKVFVITEGDWEDYHVVGVCSSKEKADELFKLTNSSGIMEMEVDQNIEHPQGCYKFMVEMDKNGNTGFTGLICYNLKESDFYSSDPQMKTFIIWAKDVNDAVVLANDQRLESLSKNNFITDDEREDQ